MWGENGYYYSLTLSTCKQVNKIKWGGVWVILEKEKCLGFSQFGVSHITSKEFLHASPKDRTSYSWLC